MLLDIGVGLLMSVFVGKIFALHAGFFLAVAGIVFSLCMDLDALINLIIHRGTEQSYKHRDMFHIPLLYIPAGILVILFYPSSLSLPLAVLFVFCSLAHFIHDSIGLGWGIRWLFPFNRDQYSFFYQYNACKAGLHPDKYGIYVWHNGEIDLLEQKYGDKSWFRHIYGNLHPYSLVEMGIFLLGTLVFLTSAGFR